MPLNFSIRVLCGLGFALALAIAACSAPIPTPAASGAPSLPASSPGASEAPAVGYFFREDFNGGGLAPDRWTSAAPAGQASVENGALSLFCVGLQTSFPYVLSNQSVIPPQGPFFFELSYKVLQSVEGDGGALPSFMLTSAPVSAPASESVFLSTTRFYNDMAINVNLSSTSQRFLAKGGYLPAGTTHLLRLEGDGLLGAYRVIFDQSEVGRFTSQLRPQQLILGLYPPRTLASPIPWSSYSFDYVDSGVLTSPVPASPYPGS